LPRDSNSDTRQLQGRMPEACQRRCMPRRLRPLRVETSKTGDAGSADRIEVRDVRGRESEDSGPHANCRSASSTSSSAARAWMFDLRAWRMRVQRSRASAAISKGSAKGEAGWA
jgi:hypothetical protein